jgi:signal transduction histidine kinase
MTGSLTRQERSTAAAPAEVGRLLHDLGQPLAAIRALAWTPPGGAGSDAAARLEHINELAAWMAALLDVAEETRPAGAGTEVGTVVLDVVVAAAAGWDGTLRFQPCAPVAVPLDPVDLRRAVANLVDNAVRAGGRVDVRLLRVADRVWVEVADDGPGFGRLPRQSGQGLAVALGVAGRCGGLLEIGPGPAGGALVRLQLPLAAAAGSR